jgi:crotonobetainyl-CoA:carnitine CoA-transferase CaiB-like acyl-CoA transferase
MDAMIKNVDGALAGLTVIDFSRMLPGPWCTQMLADLGAQVIKVEQPEVGDLGRHNEPNFKDGSVYFNTVNLNKKSITLDLNKETDVKIAQDLIKSADIVVETFRSGVTQRLGIDFETAKRINPKIIYCSITGFGQSGPFSKIPGHDLVVQSVTGIMGVNLSKEGLPVMPTFQTADYAASAYALIAILAALHRLSESGVGGYLDISMFDSLFSMTNIVNGLAMANASGNHQTSAMKLYGENPRYSIYRTKDGKFVAVSLLETRIWAHFCELINRRDLISNEETPKDRHTSHGENSIKYKEALEEFCLSSERDVLVALMVKNNVPILPVYTPDEAITSEQVQVRKLVEWVEHPTEGLIPVLANPLKAFGLTQNDRNPAPNLGADNLEIIGRN